VWLDSYVGVTRGFLYGMGGGLVVSSITAILGTLVDYIFRRLVFRKYGKRGFELDQIREIFLKGDLSEIFQRSLTSLTNVPKLKYVHYNSDENRITAKTSGSWNTIGEKIEIELFQESDRIRVQIRSRPRLKTAVFDCANNIERVEEISSFLKSTAG